MKRIIYSISILLIPLITNAQGFGFGYNYDMGGSAYSQSSAEYFQRIESYTHNAFMRFHNKKGNGAIQLVAGFRTDKIDFRNSSDFLAPDGNSMMKYNSNAFLERKALRFAAINQCQLGKKPGGILFSINTGIFYEYTGRITRFGLNDDWDYDLDDEINKNNFGFIIGGELRLWWITFGVKYEKLFLDMLNHDNILGQELNLNNSTELRGLYLNPGMFMFSMGVSLDFFKHNKE